MQTLLDTLGGTVAVGGLLALAVLGAISVFLVRGRKSNKGRGQTKKIEEDPEKREMGAKIVELDSANKELRERLRNLEMEYIERQENIKTSESQALSKEKELEEDLKEVYALKLMIDEYRGKTAKLSNEKSDLEKELSEARAKLKEGKKVFEEEMEARVKKLEEEKEAVKAKAKEMVVSYTKETEGKISALESENKALKERVDKLKQQYSAWEAIDGL